MTNSSRCLVFLLNVFGSGLSNAENQNTEQYKTAVQRQNNLVAWCIVPFDASKRGPAERARMFTD